MRTRVAMTTEETAPGTPLWGANQVVTTLPEGETEVALENLVAGKTYYVKTWNEDEFGNRSRELVRVINTAKPTREVPLSFSANGYFDSGSPMRAYIKLPVNAKSVTEAKLTLAFRQFMAPATDAASGGTSTSNTDGSSTSGNPGGLPTGAGTAHVHTVATWVSDTPGVYTKRKYSGFNSDNFNLEADNGNSKFASSEATHTHTLPGHTHTTPSHAHAIDPHTHALTYGTFEEAYPTSHDVTVKTYKRSGTTWDLRDTVTHITSDIFDIDLTSVITGAGDWRIEVISAGGQPNGGRLGCDVYGFVNANFSVL